MQFYRMLEGFMCVALRQKRAYKELFHSVAFKQHFQVNHTYSPAEIRFDLGKNCMETKFGRDVQKGDLGNRKNHRNPPMETGLTGLYM